MHESGVVFPSMHESVLTTGHVPSVIFVSVCTVGTRQCFAVAPMSVPKLITNHFMIMKSDHINYSTYFASLQSISWTLNLDSRLKHTADTKVPK